MLNLGSITFGLAADVSGLDRAARTLEGFGTRVDSAMQRAAKGMDYNTEALRRQEGAAVRALQQVQNLTARLQSVKIDPNVSTAGIERLRTAYEDLVRQMATPVNRPLDPLQFQRATLGFKEQVDAVNRSLLATGGTANQVTGDVTAAFNRQQMAAMKAENQVRSLNDQILRAASSGLINQRTADAFTARAQAAGSMFGGQMQTVGLDPRAALAANLNLKNSLTGIQRDLRQTVSAAAPLQAAFHGLADSAALVIGPLNGIVFRMRASHDMMERYGVTLGATAALMGGLAASMIGLGSEILRVTIAYQKADVTLTGLLRNSAVAAAEIDYLRQVSQDAGLSFAFLAPQFSRFVSAAQGAGQGLTETNEQFKQMAMLSGTLHLTTDEVNRVLLAFDQMLSAGRIMGDDMRQLRNVLPAAYEAAGLAAEKMGKQFRDASGKISNLNPSEFIGNLLDVYQTMFNIDMSKPIDSLQADLNRVKNSWDQMILAMSNSIGAGASFQAVFDGITNSLLWMSENMTLVMGLVGGLTGALVGLFGVMAAQALFSGVMAFFTGLQGVMQMLTIGIVAQTGSLVGYSVASQGAALTTAQLTAAQHGLNAAMTANPIGIVIRGLALLGGALFGAYTAYNAMNAAVNANNVALADTSSIDLYIAQQIKLGQQVEIVTQAMIKQARIAASANLATLNTMRTNYDRMREQYTQAQRREQVNSDPRINAAQTMGGGFAGFDPMAAFGMGSDRLKEQLLEMTPALRQVTEIVRQDTARLAALNDLLELPEATGAGRVNNNAGGDRAGRTPDPDRGLRALNDIINRSERANMLLENMWRGPTHSGLVEALDEVNRRLFDMDPDQIARLGELLSGSGIDVGALGGINDALAVVTLHAEAAEEAVKKFNRVWDDIQEGQQELRDLNEQMAFLYEGRDPEDMFLVEALQQARATIRELTTQDLPTLRDTLTSLQDTQGNTVFNQNAVDAIMAGYQGSDTAGLDALKQALAAVGFEGQTAEEALTSFYTAIGRGNADLRAASQFFGDFNTQVRGFQDTLSQWGALAGGASMQDIINLDYLQQAREATRLLSDEALAGLRQQLLDLGIAGDNVNVMLATFYRVQEETQAEVDAMRATLEAQTEAWVSFGDAGVNALQDILIAGESFTDTMGRLLIDLGNTILNAAIFDPLKQQLNQVIADMVNGRGDVGFGDILSTFGRAGTRFLGMGGPVNDQGKGLSTGEANVALDAFTAAIKDGSQTMSVDFLTSLFRMTVGTTAESSASAINVLATNAATTSLVAFTAAVSAAAAAAGAQSAGNTLQAAAMVFAADGGQVFGPGGAKGDKIPAMLSNEEFVVNAHAAQKNLRLLHIINSGADVRMFAEGGEVTPDMAGAGFYSGPRLSGLTSNQKSARIDARTTIHIHGNVDADVMDRIEAMLEARERGLEERLPYLIDATVTESSARGRYG